MKSGSRRPVVVVLALAVIAIGVFLVFRNHKAGTADGSDAGSGSPSASASADAGGATADTGGSTADAGGDAAGGGGSGHGHHHKGGGGAGGAAGGIPPTPVQVQTVTTGNLSSVVQITGNVTALHDIQVAAKATARVVAVNFREGDVVHIGEVVVQQDTTDLQATVRSDQEQTASDKAKLDEARESYQIELTQATQNVLNAEAAVNGATEAYLKLKRGNRPQDIDQAAATTLQTKSARDIALITLNRDKELYPQGAIAKSQLDVDQSTYDSDEQLYEKAVAAEKEERIGYQTEDINAAYETVKEQEANLKNQIASQRQVQVSKGAVESAMAVLAQDRDKTAYDQAQVEYAVIRSPIEGIVAARETEPGEIATAGTSLMRIVNLDTLYYQPTISETDWQATHNGEPVHVTVDALPGQKFSGKVAALYPAADTTTRVFSLRVLVNNPTHILRPGMFARGNLVTKVARDVPIIPTSALVSASTQNGFDANESSDEPVSQGMQLPAQQVVVLRSDNTVEVRPVKIGIVTMTKAQITSGVQAGEQIVIVGQAGLKTGDKVSVNQTAQQTQVAQQ